MPTNWSRWVTSSRLVDKPVHFVPLGVSPSPTFGESFITGVTIESYWDFLLLCSPRPPKDKSQHSEEACFLSLSSEVRWQIASSSWPPVTGSTNDATDIPLGYPEAQPRSQALLSPQKGGWWEGWKILGARLSQAQALTKQRETFSNAKRTIEILMPTCARRSWCLIRVFTSTNHCSIHRHILLGICLCILFGPLELLKLNFHTSEIRHTGPLILIATWLRTVKRPEPNPGRTHSSRFQPWFSSMQEAHSHPSVAQICNSRRNI